MAQAVSYHLLIAESRLHIRPIYVAFADFSIRTI